MLPILSDEQVRSVELAMVKSGAVRMIDLIERAGTVSATRIMDLQEHGAFGEAPSFVVLAGMGNNGADGLVLARSLHENGRSVRIVVIEHRAWSSAEHACCLEKAVNAGVPVVRLGAMGRLELDAEVVVVDAILGSGIDRPLQGWLGSVVQDLNAQGNIVVAIDRPTGLRDMADSSAGVHPLHARYTIAFEVPRPGFMHAGSGDAVGQWHVVPVGLDRAALRAEEPYGELIEANDIRALLQERQRFAHKGHFGHAFLIAGSAGMYGAALLAAGGCARSGVGLFTVHAPQDAIPALAVRWPDAMSSTNDGASSVAGLVRRIGPSAVGIGPGLGRTDHAACLVSTVLQDWKGPVVLDADALNILAADPRSLALLPQGAILTPHPKEMDRLLGEVITDPRARLAGAKEFARTHRCFVILKGGYSAICAPAGPVMFNPTGNPGMAKGGSGDVLTGILSGLLARGHASREACMIGVYLHGLAGDLAEQALGAEAMRADDIVAYLPAAWLKLGHD